MQDLGYASNAPRGITLPEDVARREVNRPDKERQLRSAAQMAVRARGEETLSEPESSRDDDEEEDKDDEDGK
jgi:hypothetical protein